MNDFPDNVPTYASVVSHKLVRILFLVDSLYNIKVLAADITNAFLNAQCAEKFCLKAESKFKSREGMWVIIVHVLYGLESDGASFRANLANTLRKMGFKPTFDDGNVWMRKNFLPLPQELNDYAGSGMGTDTTVLWLLPNPRNSVTMSDTPYYE